MHNQAYLSHANFPQNYFAWCSESTHLVHVGAVLMWGQLWAYRGWVNCKFCAGLPVGTIAAAGGAVRPEKVDIMLVAVRLMAGQRPI